MTVLHGGLPTRPTRNLRFELDQISDRMWGVMNHCWEHDTALRPKINEILQELGAIRLGDEPKNITSEDLGTFRDHQSVSIDLIKVGQILNGVRAFPYRILSRY